MIEFGPFNVVYFALSTKNSFKHTIIDIIFDLLFIQIIDQK